MALEEALVSSANGDFGLVLISFLVVSLVGSFLWAMKRIIDQNACFNAKILDGMKNIVEEMKEYRKSTCEELHDHDLQAKEILKEQRETRIILEQRPCISITGTK